MSEIHESAVDNGEQIQKKSENDKNGIIGGLIFGGIFLFFNISDIYTFF